MRLHSTSSMCQKNQNKIINPSLRSLFICIQERRKKRGARANHAAKFDFRFCQIRNRGRSLAVESSFVSDDVRTVSRWMINLATCERAFIFITLKCSSPLFPSSFLSEKLKLAVYRFLLVSFYSEILLSLFFFKCAPRGE